MLNYQVYNNNSNKWIVFLHGIGGSTETWKKQIDAFNQYNLLLIDLPGHGKSEYKKKITVSNVNEAIKEVLDYLHIEQADFIGLSLGSLVAVYFAIANPQKVKTLILGGAIINIEGIYKWLMKLVQTIKRFLPHRLLFNILAKIMLPKKNHAKSRHIFIRESLKMNRDMFLQWINYIKEIAYPECLLNKLKQLKINMLFISGEEDVCFLSGTKKVVSYLSKATLFIIKKCGHVCSIEKYKEFNAEAIYFLDKTKQVACV